jgi:hypothetical protein
MRGEAMCRNGVDNPATPLPFPPPQATVFTHLGLLVIGGVIPSAE